MTTKEERQERGRAAARHDAERDTISDLARRMATDASEAGDHDRADYWFGYAAEAAAITRRWREAWEQSQEDERSERAARLAREAYERDFGRG